MPEQPPHPLESAAGAPGPGGGELVPLFGRSLPGPLLLDYSLVLSAVGIAHVVSGQGDILVARRDEASARLHLQAYARENAARSSGPRSAPPARPPRAGAGLASLLLVCALCLAYLRSGPWDAGSPLFARGAVDAAAVRAGEWSRLATALFLHADAGHLVSNLVAGGAMAWFLCRHFGPGLGLLLMLAGGCAGNALNVALRQGPHLSVGFSTAVFAAVGIFAGGSMRPARGLAASLAPLAAGAALLALMGSGGERTDLGAHLFGLAAGMVLGLAAFPLERISRSAWLQALAALLSLALACLALFPLPAVQA